MSRSARTCVVLVTGGAGFLGQHMVGILQAHATHVTEIRVLDVVPYVNKLEYSERVPVKTIVGSITDAKLVELACKGANCVMHVASFVDTTLLPDEQISIDINVKGTENVISACRKYGVERLLYCSSIEVVNGQDDIHSGNEENTTPRPDGHMFKIYGATKMRAEQMVLQANSDSLRTVSLRPVVMYGELEWRSFRRIMDNFITKRTGSYFRLRCGNGRMEHAYVGNVAWGFLCAERTLVKNDFSSKAASGQCYFICDDSPKKQMFDFIAPFLKDCGLRPFPVDIPMSCIILPLYLLYFILTLVSYFYKVNFAFGFPAFLCITKISLFQYEKATRLLGYKPLYSFSESKSRTVKFLLSMKNKSNTLKC